MSEKSIFSGVLKYSVSSWVNLGVGILAVTLTTRLLSPATYGLVSLYIAASSVLMYMLTFGMDAAYLRFYNETPAGDTHSQLLYKNIAVSFLVVLITGSLSFLFFGEYISESIFGICNRWLIGSLFIYTFIQIVLRYLNISYRMSFRVKQYTIQNVLINCFTRILIIIAAFFTDGFLYVVSVVTIGMAVILCIYGIIQREEYIPVSANGELNLSLNMRGYWEYMKFAFFNAPASIVLYLSIYLTQHIIRHLMGNHELGIYSSVGMFSTLFHALQGGVGTYWIAYVYKNYSTEQNKIGRMHGFALLYAIIIASGIVIFRDLVYLVIGPEFHASKGFFSLMLVYPIMQFITQTTGSGIALAKKNHFTMIFYLISVIINIVLCYFFTKEYGLIGAAWSSVVAAIVLYILNTIMGQKYYKSIPNYLKSIVGTFILLSVLVVASIFSENMLFIITCVIILDILAILVYREEITHIWNHIIRPFFYKG